MTTILCDLSEVLIAGLVGVEEYLTQYVDEPKDRLLAAFAGSFAEELFRGRISEDTYLAALLRQEEWSIPIDTMRQLVRLNFHRKIDGMDDILAALNRKHQLVLVSDHAREWIEYISNVHAFLCIFQKRFFSFEHGYLKKEPAAFRYVLDELDIPAQSCLLIDDSPANIESAACLGMSAVRFTSATALTAQLVALGLI